MKTDDLVVMLARGLTPVDPHQTVKQFGGALFWGSLGALGLMWLTYGVRPDWVVALFWPMFWCKLAFALALAWPAGVLVWRLGHPGMRLHAMLWVALVLPFIVVLICAWWVLMDAPSPARLPLVLGSTWKHCAANIVLLSLPVVAAVFGALRRMAPTQPRLAGAGAGLLCGAVATFFYALHCPEMQLPFWAVWYGLGILLVAGLGAWLGPRWLSW